MGIGGETGNCKVCKNLLLGKIDQPAVEGFCQFCESLLSARVEGESGSQLVQVVDQENGAILSE